MYLDSNKTRLRRTVGVFAALICVAMIPMISLAAGPGTGIGTGISNYIAEPASLATDLAFYAGAFSTAVTASVNPTATIAVLSILGAIENAAVSGK